MLISLPALLLVAMRLRTTVFPATWDAQQHAGVVAGVVDEAVSGVRVVKGFGQEDRELAHLADASRDLYSSRARLVRVQARYTPILAAIPSFTMVAILGLGGWLVTEGHISYGTFFAFMTYVALMVPPVRMLAGLFAIGQQARAGADRVLDILDTNPLITEKPDADELPAVRGEIHFDDVRFGYTADQPVLDHFDLTVAPGEVVALVGSSGSGKSTVTALLPRFYDVGAGTHHRRRHRRPRRHARLAAPPGGRGVRRGVPVLRVGGRQHRVRPPRCQCSRHRGRSGGRRRGRVHRRAARRLRHRGGRAGADPLGRPAPAHRPGPGHPHQPPHPGARRRHLGGGRGHRRGHPRHAAPVDDRSHHHPHRPPPLHPATGPAHRGHRSRPGGGPGHPRGAHGRRRALPDAAGRTDPPPSD